MLQKLFAVSAAILLLSTSAMAQERGTVEFGVFGSVATFDNTLALSSARGVGGRVGVFLDPRWSIEFEDIEMRASRPNGLTDVNVGIRSGRLIAVPVKAGAFSLLLGAGAGTITETDLHGYGVNAIVGAKLALGTNTSLRIDAQQDWLANYNWKNYKSLRAGFSFYRHPIPVVKTVTIVTPAPPAQIVEKVTIVHDTVQLETKKVIVASSSTIAQVTMEEKIYFAFNKSDLTDSSKKTLDSKVTVFQDNPSLKIIVVGNADTVGSNSYNLVLGFQRAAASKSYLISKGIDAVRIEITSDGKKNTISNDTALNRRDEFKLIVGSDYLVTPKP